MSNSIQFVKEGEYRINSLDEIPNLQTLIEELRGGRKLWIESTNVFACLYSSRVWDECNAEDMYAESSLAFLGDLDEDDFEELSLLSPVKDKGAVAAATARILGIPDDYYQSVVTYGDESSFLDGFIGTSFFTGGEMQSFLSKNSKRQYVFQNCSFNPQQAVTLLKSSTEVSIVLSTCSFDEDCHSLAAYSGLLLDNDTARSGELRFHAHGRADPFFLKNLSFMENMLLDKLILSSFNFDEVDCRRAGEAKVTSLTLENCLVKEGSGEPLIAAIRSGEMYASTLNVKEEDADKPCWREIVSAIGSPQCALQALRFEGTKWSPDLCNILIESLRTNETLMELAISAKPSDFREQWNTFLDVIGSHKTLKKVTMLPQADSESKWLVPLADLFRTSHRIVLFFYSNDSEESEWSLQWNAMCLKLRFRNIPRLVEDGTRSFVLTSVMATHNENTDHLYSLLKANQDFISVPR